MARDIDLMATGQGAPIADGSMSEADTRDADAGPDSDLLPDPDDPIAIYFAMRNWQDAEMPFYGSFIGLDLVMFLYTSRLKETPYSLKDVFHSLHYSEGSLRIFIRRLAHDGWIKLETWPGDRRNKKIIVDETLHAMVGDYLGWMKKIGL